MPNYIQAVIPLLFINYDDWGTIRFDRKFEKGRDEMNNECVQFDLSGLKIRFMDGTEIPDGTVIYVNGERLEYNDIAAGKFLSVVENKDNFYINLCLEGK
jgi:hypothetical protein